MLFFIMLVVFCLIKGRRCRKHTGSTVLTREFADTAPEARSFIEHRSEIEEVTHTLYQQDIRVFWASTQIFHGITFAQGHSLTHSVLRCRCPPISSVLHPLRISPSHFILSFEISRVHIQEECGPSLWLFP